MSVITLTEEWTEIPIAADEFYRGIHNIGADEITLVASFSQPVGAPAATWDIFRVPAGGGVTIGFNVPNGGPRPTLYARGIMGRIDVISTFSHLGHDAAANVYPSMQIMAEGVK